MYIFICDVKVEGNYLVMCSWFWRNVWLTRDTRHHISIDTVVALQSPAGLAAVGTRVLLPYIAANDDVKHVGSKSLRL